MSRSPGRFFVAQELKALFAYLILNYDIKSLPERPKGSWIGKTLVPPTDATMVLRRRPGTSAARTLPLSEMV